MKKKKREKKDRNSIITYKLFVSYSATFITVVFVWRIKKEKGKRKKAETSLQEKKVAVELLMKMRVAV